jgi:hypothetical protein
MHKGGVDKLETRLQILELFQGVNLVLLIETWHLLGQHHHMLKGLIHLR